MHARPVHTLTLLLPALLCALPIGCTGATPGRVELTSEPPALAAYSIPNLEWRKNPAWQSDNKSLLDALQAHPEWRLTESTPFKGEVRAARYAFVVTDWTPEGTTYELQRVPRLRDGALVVTIQLPTGD